MKHLDRYVMRTVGMTILLVMLAIVGILSIFNFIDEIEDMKYHYGIVEVIRYTVYSMPRTFYDAIPYGALIGCLAGLGLLAGNSELIVMRASGVSTWSISWSALKPVLVLVVVGMLMGEYLLPDLERVARNDRSKAMSSENQITPFLGFWYRENNVYMHFEEVQGGLLGGVNHYYFDAQRHLRRTLYAERAVYHDVRDEEKYWLMEKVLITDIFDDHTESRHLPSLRWDTRLAPDTLRTEILVQPDKMSMQELSAKIDTLDAQGMQSGKFELGFWRKALQPAATIGLVFVAISFIFGPLRESTMGMRVVAGLVVGILFKFVQGLLSPASLVFGFSPLIAVIIPIVLCLAFGAVLLRRAS
ncbi:MAG: LPS export ABC transporter permease LptG [Pseudomonadales bacterium]|nr:LPS export ABC transporter permease LptG [Pseudomonadales bacterium]